MTRKGGPALLSDSASWRMSTLGTKLAQSGEVDIQAIAAHSLASFLAARRWRAWSLSDLSRKIFTLYRLPSG